MGGVERCEGGGRQRGGGFPWCGVLLAVVSDSVS